MISPDLHTSLDLSLVDEIRQARKAFTELDSPVLKTELIYDDLLSERYEADIWLASELHQSIGAYKIRGAFNFVQSLTAEEGKQGIVAASAGNHGQGIALSASRLGINSYIFMPESTPSQKVERVSELGGVTTKVTLTGETFDDCEVIAQQYCDNAGAVFAHPFNDRRVIAGQGTLGAEIAEELPGVDTVLCPVGGGGLLAGVATALKDNNSGVEIIGIEPEGAASMKEALKNGSSIPISNKIDTFVDGASVQQVGNITFELARPLLGRLFNVSNLELRRVTTELWERKTQPLRVELAAALSVAGLSRVAKDLKGKSVVCIVTGGNLSEERYQREVRLSK